ncbi:MAG: hypothetical protein BroJett018_21520 [Chloroflexota bacterium]|nr:MAG: hypothetical protein BroJett018_21520 [Chloroflexota bacterium]
MSKSKKPSMAGSKSRHKQKDWPLVVYAWIGGLGLIGYIVAEMVINTRPHPLHWLTGLLAGVLGYFVGQLWYHQFGDID